MRGVADGLEVVQMIEVWCRWFRDGAELYHHPPLQGGLKNVKSGMPALRNEPNYLRSTTYSYFVMEVTFFDCAGTSVRKVFIN